MDETKYDRQIRLFGFETQKRLGEMAVQVLGAPCLTTAEIVKNLTLIGIKKLVIRPEFIDAVKQIVPNSLNEINETMEIEYATETVKSDFRFLVDTCERTDEPFYFVCSKCFTIKKNGTEHKCLERTVPYQDALECMAGALAVQEFIKMVQGKETIEEYTIKI